MLYMGGCFCIPTYHFTQITLKCVCVCVGNMYVHVNNKVPLAKMVEAYYYVLLLLRNILRTHTT